MTSLADNREQHMQRFHDQLMAWQEDINRLRAKAFTANSYIQGEMNRLVTQMDKGVEQLTERLIEMAEKGDRRVYTALENMESAWGSLRGTISDTMERMRDKRGEAGDRIEEAVDRGRDMLERGRDAVQRGASDLQENVKRGADEVQDTVKRGARQARQALDTDQQGGQTTVSASAGRRPAGTSDTGMDSGAGQQGGRTQSVGASVTVSRTPRGQH